MKNHQKHAKLVKTEKGNFGRNEFSFVGTPCGVIKDLTERISEHLCEKYKITYVDADHADSQVETLHCNISTRFVDKINFQQIDYKIVSNFQRKFLLNEQDLILVNGNHFEASQQLVFIDSRKEKSLLKRLTQLTNIKAFILCEGMTEIYDFLKTNNWQNIPIFQADESEKIAEFIEKQVINPPLNGLVLAGGQSTRMGSDKGLLTYHGKPQQEFMLELLAENCEETYLSCRKEQNIENIKIIEDTFLGLGPFGAILSAFRHDPNAAWLVIACDLPLLDKKTLDVLLEKRNSSKIATAFYNPATNFPEPLITIWEPKAYQILLNFLAQGISCPRKVLINSEIETVYLENSEVLMNANTIEEFEKAKTIINS